MSPTTILCSGERHVGTGVDGWGGRGVPGVVRDWGGPGGAIPGTHPVPSQGPIYSIIQSQGPTYGQMKAISAIL